MSTISSITLLTKFNVRDLGAVEEKVVDFGVDEVFQSFFSFYASLIYFLLSNASFADSSFIFF